MDKSDLQHGFEQVRHRAAKRVIKEPKFNFNKMYNYIVLPLIFVHILPQLLVEEWTDDQTTDATAEVQQRFQQDLSEITGISSDKDRRTAQNFIEGVLFSSDLSEQGAYDLLQGLQNKMGDIDEIAGYKIGNIGDLRECRVETTTGNVQDIAACTVDAEQDDIFFQNMDNTATVIALLLMLGYGVGGLARRNSKIQSWGEKTPRHPRFKH